MGSFGKILVCMKCICTDAVVLLESHSYLAFAQGQSCAEKSYRKGVSSDLTYFKIFVRIRLHIKKSFLPGRALLCCNTEASELWDL